MAHCRAYHAIKKVDSKAQVGMAKHIVLFEPKRWWSLLDVFMYRVLDSTSSVAAAVVVVGSGVRTNAREGGRTEC